MKSRLKKIMEVVAINPNMEKQNKTQGNTLDFYNEDMSRKAVGKLFDDMEFENGDNSASYDTADANSEMYETYPLPPPPPQERPAERPQATQQSNSYPDFYAQRPEPKEKVISKVSFEDLGLDERNSSQGRRGAENMSDSGSYRRISELPYNPSPPRSVQNVQHTQTRIATVPRAAAAAPRTSPENRRYVANENRFNDTYSDLMDERNQKILKYALAGILFVLVLIMFILLLRIGSLQKRIVAIETSLEDIGTNLETAVALDVKVASLQESVTNLQTTLTEEPPEITSGDPTDTDPTGTENPGTTVTPPPNTTGTPSTGTNPSGQRTYTVQGGDTLSKISQTFYDDQSSTAYNKIKEANGMTSDALKVGQVLIIP